MTRSHRHAIQCLILTAAMLSADPGILSAQALDPVSYTIRFPAPATHRRGGSVGAGGRTDGYRLMMATWTPGSYLIREYARHVEAVRAATPAGEPLAVAKSSKNPGASRPAAPTGSR